MAKTSNFGIDLCTTNSVIAKAEEGKVEIFRNPMSMKETLPSVVAFRKNRILVGDKAREFLERDPGNVVGAFKRKMGTAERFHIVSTGEDKSPVELSALVLRELQNFVHTGEKVEAAVITIPAAFDTVQSNATKEAGLQAGFQHVTLLQEPIAASLAYVNKNEEDDELLDGQWMVYDLGGGTFDVALVRVLDGEMRVMDHEGNNFLGGADFDALIVEKLIAPHLMGEGTFTDLVPEMKKASGKYNKLFYKLLHLAEEAKIQLSSHETADIELEVEDETGELLDIYFTIQRSAFEALIEPYIQDTIRMMQTIMVRNHLDADDLSYVLMVGGSTYIPYVRRVVERDLGVRANCNIDPTAAVGLGAAHYAATRTWSPAKEVVAGAAAPEVTVRMAYQKTSQDEAEYFVAEVKGGPAGMQYRLIREDGGYDSGLKPLQGRIEEDLPLATGVFNLFKLSLYLPDGSAVEESWDSIGIMHGRFSVTGQPLPNDICMEVDHVLDQETRLEAIFNKNEILPLRRTINKVVTRTIRKGSSDRIEINVLEGPESALPSVNQRIGFIAISGEQLDRDLIRGSDVEITLEISESRDLRITTFLLMTDQEFVDVFNASERTVDAGKLRKELNDLIEGAHDDLLAAQRNEDTGLAERLSSLISSLEGLMVHASNLADDDVTDLRYQLEDRKRKLAQDLSTVTQDQAVTQVKLDYFEMKRYCLHWLDSHGTEIEKKSYEDITSGEKMVLASDHKRRIKDLRDRVFNLATQIRWRSPEYLSDLFDYYARRRDECINKSRADELISEGTEAARKGDVHGLQHAINGLYELLPARSREYFNRGTGLG